MAYIMSITLFSQFIINRCISICIFVGITSKIRAVFVSSCGNALILDLQMKLIYPEFKINLKESPIHVSWIIYLGFKRPG